MIQKLIKQFVGHMGFEIRRKRTPDIIKKENSFTMRAALKRSLERGLEVATVIDVGASDGRWSRGCLDFLPNSNYLLVEAQEGHRTALENFKKEFPNVDFVLAAAGYKGGKIYFDDSDLFGGVASEHPIKDGIIVPVVSLDEQVTDRRLIGPYLLKLDTHGFEVPILKGAQEIIKNSSLIILETYNFKITDKSLRYWEMCSYMETLGFSTVENVDLMLRQKDNAFWQMDTFFVPTKNKIFLNQSYS